MPRVIAPLRDFLHRESSSGILILMASALGLLVANSPLADQYNSLLGFDFKFGISDIYVELTILKSINYVLMTIFFFVVGLEIKRELTSGHLASFKKAVMPFVAALGGMAVPALIYLAIAGDVEANGWGVPVATDIALAVGLLAMVGTSAVASLRSFLLALAVIDDIGAILIIALVCLIDSEDGSVSVIEWLESRLHPWSSFVIVPLFAFANTGVEISATSIRDAIGSPIAWGIFFGLVLGKPIGVLAATYLARKVRLGEYPEDARNIDIAATGSAAGIGFTVAIFIANLAFDDAQTQDLAVFAVITASIVSGVIGFLIFKLLGRRTDTGRN